MRFYLCFWVGETFERNGRPNEKPMALLQSLRARKALTSERLFELSSNDFVSFRFLTSRQTFKHKHTAKQTHPLWAERHRLRLRRYCAPALRASQLPAGKLHARSQHNGSYRSHCCAPLSSRTLDSKQVVCYRATSARAQPRKDPPATLQRVLAPLKGRSER